MSLEIQALSDPKRKLTAKLRKRYWHLHEHRLQEPWWKKGSYKRPAGFVQFAPISPKPFAEKVVTRLARLPLSKLAHFVKQSARRAATAKNSAAKYCPGKIQNAFLAEQDRQIILMRAGQRMINVRFELATKKKDAKP